MKNKIINLFLLHGFIGDKDAMAMGIGNSAFFRIMESLVMDFRFQWERMADGSDRFRYIGVK